jgi:hypothetical protein
MCVLVCCDVPSCALLLVRAVQGMSDLASPLLVVNEGDDVSVPAGNYQQLWPGCFESRSMWLLKH